MFPVFERSFCYTAISGRGGLLVEVGGIPPPSANWTTAGLGGLVADPVGGIPPPSAKATEANDISNSVTAKARFIGDSPYLWGIPQGDSLVGGASGRDFRRRTSEIRTKEWSERNPILAS